MINRIPFFIAVALQVQLSMHLTAQTEPSYTQGTADLLVYNKDPILSIHKGLELNLSSTKKAFMNPCVNFHNASNGMLPGLTFNALRKDLVLTTEAVAQDTSYIERFANEWPSFRGPGSIGVARPTNTSTHWDHSTGEGIQWSVDIPLPGFNSPIVWGNRIFLTGANKEELVVYCFDADNGKMNWSETIKTSSPRPRVTEDAGYCAPTMTTDGKRLFAIFATGDIAAFDFEGTLLWQKNLGLPDNPYGMGSSLISDGHLLFIQYDHFNSKKLLALDGANGELVWQANRSHVSWSSPALIETGNQLQLILNDEKNVTAYDPASGGQLWQVECLDGEVAPSPSFNGEDIIFVANEYARATAIKMSDENAEILWQYDGLLPEISSPLAAKGLFFIATHRGEIICLDGKTGNELWVQEFDAEFRSSPVQVGDRIYIADTEGVMHIFRAVSAYIRLGTVDMGEPVFATPAFVDGRIFIRTEKKLYCIREGVSEDLNRAQEPTVRNPFSEEGCPWLAMELYQQIGDDITDEQIARIRALPSNQALEKIKDDIAQKGMVFWSIDGNAYRETTDWNLHMREFRKALTNILTEEQKARFADPIDPDLAWGPKKKVEIIENPVVPGQQIDFEGSDWPCFMGPSRNGVSEETGLLRQWPEGGPPVLWSVPVGDGYAGPAIVKDKVYLLDRVGMQEIFRCYDLATGNELWNYTYTINGVFMREGSRTVPAIDGDYAYTCGSLGDLYCFDLNFQKPVWEYHFWNEYGQPGGPPWGISQNPLIYKDLVIVAPQTTKAGVIAFDKRNGKVRWASEPLGDFGYSNPSIVTIDGEEQLAMVAACGNWQVERETVPYQGVVGIDFKTGETLWRYRNWECGTPIPYVVDAGQNRLFITAGYTNGSALFRVKKIGKQYETEEIYKKMAFESHIHAPLVYEDHFYAQCTGKGRQDGMTCWSIDGELKWKTGKNPQFDKGGMLLVDGMIITIDGKDGKLYLLEATPEKFTVLSVAQMLDRSMCWAPLALSRGKLIIRDQKRMKCLIVK